MDYSRPRSIIFLCNVEGEWKCITESCVYMDLGARLATRVCRATLRIVSQVPSDHDANTIHK